MMGLIDAVVSYVVNKVGDLLYSEIALHGNTRRDLEWVQSELRMMDAVLEHVATMKIEDPHITKWTEEVRRLAFHAEDVVDTFSCLVDVGSTPARKTSRNLSQIKLKRDFGTDVTQLRERVNDLKRQKETYDIKIPDTSSAAGTVDQMDDLLQIRRLRSAPYVEDRDVVGLEDHVKAVNNLLARDGSRRSVVSIVGMGGLGKTTLAKKVYNNILGSSSSFECTAWVDVSQKYDIDDLLKKIARDIMKISSEDVGKMDQGTVTEKLFEFIRSKKYLIVLDDVWTSELWELLDDNLPDPNNGSRIITTTRKIEVAESANPWLSPYKLTPLGDVESRVLFTKKAFPNEDDPEQCCNGELANLREQILKRCDGLPLAIIVMGGLLSRKERTPKVWSEVAKKIDWEKTKRGKECMGILALSYIDLPIHLRWCFLYLAAIPEDCVIQVSRLQRLWIGEGFIEEKAGRSFEEMAETYFEELVQRCLIQVVQETTAERYIRVHDLLLELAVSEAEKIRFLDTWRTAPDASPRAIIRRLSFTPDRIEGSSTHLPLGSNKLRSLLITIREDWSPWGIVVGRTTDLGKVKWSTIKENLKLLRVLHLSVNIDGLSEGIGDLVNLRYLAICGEWITELPESVGNLRHLQILDVARTEVGLLPNTIWQIKTLRYLLGGQITEFPMPKDSLPDDTFKNLRVLDSVRGVPSMEKIFPYLTNLEELALDIEDFSMPVLYDSIKSLQRLHVLHLWATALRHCVTVNMDEIFLPSDSHPDLHTLSLDTISVVASQLQRLPQNLKHVALLRRNISRNIIELLGKLEHLHRLILSEISFIEDDEEMVFHSGWFPQLHVLDLYCLRFKRWELEGQSLPLLRELKITQCSRLTVLPEGLRRISTLRVFKVWGGPSQLLARLQKPEDGGREGEDWHKIKHVEDVRIY